MNYEIFSSRATLIRLQEDETNDVVDTYTLSTKNATTVLKCTGWTTTGITNHLDTVNLQ